MRFEFDPKKAQENLRKHGVSFELAMRVWSDPFHEITFDQVKDGEDRYHAVGYVGGKLLIVSHTYPDEQDDELAAILSARKATTHERKQYEEGDL